MLNSPDRVTADGSGNLYFSVYGRIRKVNNAGTISTVAGSQNLSPLGDGGPATSAKLSSPAEATIDGAGNLVIADASNNRVRVVAESTGTFYGVAMTAGDVYTVAGNKGRQFSGDGGPATKASLFSPDGVTVTSAGNLVIADGGNNRIRQVTG